MDAEVTLPGPVQLSSEARLLLALAQPTLDRLDAGLLCTFLSARGRELDWGWLVDQSARQAVLPLVARSLTRLRTDRSPALRRAVPYEWLYHYVYQGNRARNAMVGTEQGRILEMLTRRSLRYCVRKGPVLIDWVYRGDLGARRVGDLDLLLSPDELPAATRALRDLGYLQGQPDETGQEIVEFDRTTQVFWKTRLTHVTLPFMKIAPAAEVGAFIVDPCLNLFPPGFETNPEVNGEILSRRMAAQVWSAAAWALDPADQLLDLCVQFHAEATTLHYISIGKDLTVAKLIEIAELSAQVGAAAVSDMLDRADRYRCMASIHYALHFSDLLFPGRVPAVALARSRPASLDYLEEFGGFDGRPKHWSKDFFGRLFDQGWRSDNAVSRIPGPRARI